jgi:hypothetical protein
MSRADDAGAARRGEKTGKGVDAKIAERRAERVLSAMLSRNVRRVVKLCSISFKGFFL